MERFDPGKSESHQVEPRRATAGRTTRTARCCGKVGGAREGTTACEKCAGDPPDRQGQHTEWLKEITVDLPQSSETIPEDAAARLSSVTRSLKLPGVATRAGAQRENSRAPPGEGADRSDLSLGTHSGGGGGDITSLRNAIYRTIAEMLAPRSNRRGSRSIARKWKRFYASQEAANVGSGKGLGRGPLNSDELLPIHGSSERNAEGAGRGPSLLDGSHTRASGRQAAMDRSGQESSKAI